MTLAFLQSGDRLRTDRMCSDGACVEALTALKFRRDSVSRTNSVLTQSMSGPCSSKSPSSRSG